jgi:hypothetical protein
MTSYLTLNGYVINPKKLFRIMKEANLLKLENRIDKSGYGRKFVKFRKVKTVKPFHSLEMDIKMFWNPSAVENTYLLSVIDLHTRRILIGVSTFIGTNL